MNSMVAYRSNLELTHQSNKNVSPPADSDARSRTPARGQSSGAQDQALTEGLRRLTISSPTGRSGRGCDSFSAKVFPDGLGCMARMRLLGASGNACGPVNATETAPQRSLGKANALRAWFGKYLWDHR